MYSQHTVCKKNNIFIQKKIKKNFNRINFTFHVPPNVTPSAVSFVAVSALPPPFVDDACTVS